MAHQTWNQIDNPYQPFTEQEWEDGNAHVESGITSSPYSTHPAWRDYNRYYYDTLRLGFPFVCCSAPTSRFYNETIFVCWHCRTIHVDQLADARDVAQVILQTKIRHTRPMFDRMAILKISYRDIPAIISIESPDQTELVTA